MYSLHAFWLSLNEYFDTWFGYSLLITLIPLYVGAILYCVFVTSNTVEGRNVLIWGTSLSLVSTALFWTWECIYINAIYSKRYVYDGVGSMEEGNYN